MAKKIDSVSNSMMHFNGNTLCVVDVETSGLDPMLHDIIEIAVLPVNARLEVRNDVLPFHMFLKPGRPQNINKKAMSVHGVSLTDLEINGVEPFRAADLFDDWFNRLGLPERKMIIPLAHNWPFDREFVRQWLGHEHFNHYFHGQYRDTMPAALYYNDKASFHAQRIPFPKVKLTYLASQLDVTHGRSHSALEDCKTTLDVYKKLMYFSPPRL